MQFETYQRPFRLNWLGSGVIALSVILLSWSMREEIAYFFSPWRPEVLGRAEEMPSQALVHNRYVEIIGIARDMCIRSQLSGRKVRFSYFMGSEAASRVMIESPLSGDEECTGAEERPFRGRLLALTSSHRYQPVYEYYRDHFSDVPQPEAMFILREGIAPKNSWWAPTLVALVAVFWSVHFWFLRRQNKRRMEGEKDESEHL